MTICDIQARHLSKFFRNSLDILIVTDHPKLVTESVNRSNEIIFGLCRSITHDECVQHIIVGISKKHRLDIRIIHTNVFHTILFLITTCQFMFFDHAIEIIIHISTNHKTILCLAVHCLCVDIILLFAVLNQPTFLLKGFEILGRFLIDTRIILGCSRFEIDFWFNDVIEAHLVITGFYSCLLRFQHIIRTGFNFLNKILRRTYPLKRFDYSHS